MSRVSSVLWFALPHLVLAELVQAGSAQSLAVAVLNKALFYTLSAVVSSAPVRSSLSPILGIVNVKVFYVIS